MRLSKCHWDDESTLQLIKQHKKQQHAHIQSDILHVSKVIVDLSADVSIARKHKHFSISLKIKLLAFWTIVPTKKYVYYL